MKELEKTKLSKIKQEPTITVDDVIKKVIKVSPNLNTKRQDLQRGQSYYISGGDPDRRNQI